MVIENGMHRYFEVSAIQDYKITSTLSDVIRTIHESKRPAKLYDDNISIVSGLTEYPNL